MASAGTSAASGSSGAASRGGQAGAAGGQAGIAGSQAAVPVGGQAGAVVGGQAGATVGGSAGASGEAGAAGGGQAGDGGGGQAGSGQVPGCTSDDGCASPESPCQVAVCTTEHTCATKPVAAGKVVATENDGCTLHTCDAQGNPQVTVPKQGTTCGNGGYCNDLGTCGECVTGINRCVDGGHQSLCPADGHWTDAASCDGLPCGAASGECIGVQQVVVGSLHACALLTDGTVRCWGDNASGQLGPAQVEGHGPREVTGLKDVVKVAAGHSFSCALTKGGTVHCWGDPTNGQLGVVNPEKAWPQKVSGSYRDLSSKGSHSCGVTLDGRVACWGLTTQPSYPGEPLNIAPVPTTILRASDGLPLAGVKQVISGQEYSCAWVPGPAGDALLCWGRWDAPGQPIPGFDVTTVAQNVTAGLKSQSFSRVVDGARNAAFSFYDNDYKVSRTFLWGSPTGTKGTSNTNHYQAWFQGTATSEVALGEEMSALVTPGQFAFYGKNSSGRFGNGKIASNASVQEEWTLKLPGAEHVAIGPFTVCAWRTGGEVWCWGRNYNHQAAPDLDQIDVLTPTRMTW